jgi:copper chaperone
MFKTVTFEVIGDHRLFCEGCERRVEGLLKALQGVRQVRAQARKQRIEVLFDAATLDADTIAEGLAKAGYETRVGSSTADSGRSTQAERRPAGRA